MLTKPSYLLALAAVALAFPAVALAAVGGGGAPERAGEAGSAGPSSGPSSLYRPAERFADTVETLAARGAAERAARAATRARREAREERERFEALPGGVSIETLSAIAACESGGDPTIVSADGSYRGKYQFSVSTWETVGGSGDPAAAPEHEQDYRAALLYARSGSSPWPVCG